MARSIHIAALLVCMLGILPGCAHLGTLSPLARLERSLLFRPAPYPDGNWQPVGLDYEDAWFEAADGGRLHGWFVPHPRPRAIALFLHGNAGNITSRASILRHLHQRHGLAVMAFDYRGYGRSKGKPNEQGILKDARAARAWLAQRTDVSEGDIVLIGRSLGGGVAVDLAANDGARGLVLASTFTSLPDVGAHHLHWLPTQLLMSNRLDSLAKIRRYDGPLLQSHGDADRVVPYELGRKLFEAAPGPKQFVTIAGAGHNDPWNNEFHKTLDEFLESIQSSNPPFANRGGSSATLPRFVICLPQSSSSVFALRDAVFLSAGLFDTEPSQHRRETMLFDRRFPQGLID